MSSYVPVFVPTSSDPSPSAVTAALTLSGVIQYSNPIAVSGYAWVDLEAALTSTGVSTLSGIIFYPQWTLVTAPASAADWSPVFREEFNVGAAPTGNGQATESTYSTLISVAAGDLPTRKAGITVRTRGLWMRFGVVANGAVANVGCTLYALRRTV